MKRKLNLLVDVEFTKTPKIGNVESISNALALNANYETAVRFKDFLGKVKESLTSKLMFLESYYKKPSWSRKLKQKYES